MAVNRSSSSAPVTAEIAAGGGFVRTLTQFYHILFPSFNHHKQKSRARRAREQAEEKAKVDWLAKQYPGHRVYSTSDPNAIPESAVVVFTEDRRANGSHAMRAIAHPLAKLPASHPVYVHSRGCGCANFDFACPVEELPAVSVAAGLEFFHDSECHSPAGAMMHRKHGLDKCIETGLWYMQQDHTPIGNNYTIADFNGSPQQHAVLNRHLLDYFKGVARSRETTPYAVDTSQLYLLDQVGMERPQPDAPTVPHGLHKSIEEFQLKLMRQWLAPNEYGLISVKASKTHLLPAPGSVQNPVYEAKDVSRYPGAGLTTSHLRDFPVHFLHDVSSVVGPHELVERLVADNPSGHLFVTGMNPIEVVDRVKSFEPASHVIDYDLESFNFVFTGSESSAYYTPITTTVSWLRTAAVVGSNGLVYQVVLLDYKLGHCVWHIFQSDVAIQDSRTFSTGSYVQVPAVLTGTWSDEWLPSKMLTAILSFAPRTPDTSFRNYAAKVAQLMTNTLPKMTAREHWIATHLVHQLPGNDTWSWRAKQALWKALALVTFQWNLLKSAPDLYDFVDERKRYRVLHPTMGGGWTPACKSTWTRASIPNNPSWLQRLSAFTSAAFTFILPKLLIGEVVSHLVMHVPVMQVVRHLLHWADVSPLRLGLTVAIVAITSILPGHVVKVFTRLAGHFWRQLWLPGWISTSIERLITEVCGGPGARWAMFLPGRGWFYQTYLWALGLVSIFPNLIAHWVVPWLALHSPFGLLLVGWWLMIFLENLIANCKAAPLDCPIEFPNRNWSYGCGEWVRDFVRSDFDAMVYPLHVVVWHSGSNWMRWVCWLAKRQLNAVAQWLPVSRGVLLSQPAFVNLPALPQVQPRVVTARNVDRPLPAVTLQTRLQAAPGAGQIAVDPTGMRFHEWVQEVQRAYATATTRYPALTPGQACFWDAVSSFGGTAHMWYSWFMDYTSTVPDPNNNVVGNVVQADMLNFAAASQFGLRLTGMLEIAHDAQGGWPVINLRLTRSPIMGQLHVELAGPTADTAAIGALARLIRTVRDIWPAWDRAFQRDLNLAAVDSVPVASDWMLAVLGVHQPVASRDEIVAAVLGSYACTPISPVNQEGFTFDLNVAYNTPYPMFFSYRAPVANQRIASTPARSMWKKFSNVARGLRLVVPETFVEPARAVSKPVDSSLDLKVTKIGATLAQNNDNAVRNNEAPRPARWTVLRNELATVLHKYKALQLPAVSLAEEVIQYTADIDRAARLVADLKAHPHVLGSRGNPVILQALDSILDLHKLSGAKITVPVRAYLGVAGSGKTTATVAYLHTLEPAVRQQVRIASHTESLRAQTKLQLDFPELKGFNFPTIPSLITEPSVGPIVLDEAGKYWGGMLDLIILANPLVSEVVVNGDPAQGMARFPVSNTQSEYDLSPLAALAPHVTRYATVSHRMFRTLADVLGVHTTNSVVGHVTHTIAAKIGLPVCTASPRYMGVLAGAGRRAYTYEGVQGEDFREDMEVDATGLESAILDRTAYVALTRSRTGVFLHMEPLNPLANAKTQPTGSDLLNAILFGMRERNQSFADPSYWLSRAAFARHLELCMPMLPWFAPIGATIPTADFQLVANPATSHMPTDGTVEDSNGVDLAPSAAPPIDEFVRETHWHAKEHREVAGRGGATNQFKETAFVNPHVHARADTATYFLSVAKRLTSRTQQANLRRMLACPRRDMCDEFDRLVPVAPKWTPAKHAEYTDRSINEYTSTRTAEAVYGKLRAHDPDRTGCDIKITLKNQVIKKDEKRHKKEAIPGQLVHEYDIRQTLEDAPFALFLEDELIDAFPSNFLFYRRMSPQGFIDKYQSRWRVNNGVYSSDVTRWDVGCDAGMLNFDVHVMRRCGLPNDYIESYMERRLSSRSQHGGMGTMQNSGDRYTWSLNSIRRAVVTSLINAVRPEDTVAINGDDSAIDRFALSERFDDSPWEFKDQNGMRGEFSGFELGGPKPEYSAGGILYRTMILESRDPSAMDKWVNYLGLLEFANPETPEAADVARSAQRHMQPHLFARYLPAALRPMFPDTQWFVSN